MVILSMIVLDDISGYYNYEVIKNYLIENNLELIQESQYKASYKKQ